MLCVSSMPCFETWLDRILESSLGLSGSALRERPFIAGDWWFIDKTDIAIGISLLSFGLSCVSLAWNIFRELWLRPRLRVSIAVALVGPARVEMEQKIVISGTNFGPGKIRVSIVRCDRSSLLSRLLRRAKYGFVIHDYENPMSGQLPTTLDVGERVDLIFPFDADCMLSKQPSRVGLRDNFGRDHWVPRKSLKLAQDDYDRTFSALAMSEE